MSLFKNLFKRNKPKEKERNAAALISAQAQSLSIGSLLTRETIYITNQPCKKSEVLKHLVQLVASQENDFPVETAFQKVMEREKVESTFMESGFAIPHARLPHLKTIMAALGILPQGLGESKPNLVFLFLSPEGEFTAHLQILSRASWLFKNENLKSSLLNSTRPDQVLKLIQNAEREASHGTHP